jgi:hypothetical protein
MAHLRRSLRGSPPALSAAAPAWPRGSKKITTGGSDNAPTAASPSVSARRPHRLRAALGNTSAPSAAAVRAPPIDRRLRFARTHQPDPRSSAHARRREKHARLRPPFCLPQPVFRTHRTSRGEQAAWLPRASVHHQARSRRTVRLSSHGARALGRPAQTFPLSSGPTTWTHGRSCALSRRVHRLAAADKLSSGTRTRMHA